MKRYGDIYPKIYDMDNLRLAHIMARKDKSFYKEVQMVNSNEEYYLKQIQYMLKNKTYSLKSDDYTVFKKNDKGKIREIHKLDYFPHRIIQWALNLLWLVFMIIDSMEGEKGIAIGSLFSQWDGNFYLTPFDHWLKEEIKVRYYYRYMDDLVILSSDKDWLHYIRREVQKYLKENLDLELNSNYQVFPVDIRGIDFVGYRHFRDYILLRKSTARNIKRKMRRIKAKLENGGKLTYSEWCCINSYKGWLKWCNGYNLYKKYIKPLEPYCEEYYLTNIKKVV